MKMRPALTGSVLRLAVVAESGKAGALFDIDLPGKVKNRGYGGRYCTIGRTFKLVFNLAV